MIKLTTINPQGQWQSFSIQGADLEVVYQTLQDILQRGDILVNATWLDAQGCLPLESFQTPPFCNPMAALRQQWEALLGQPLGQALPKAELGQPLIDLRQHRLTSVHRTLGYTQDWVERAHQHLKDGPQKVRMLNHYGQLLARYSSLLIRMETNSTLP